MTRVPLQSALVTRLVGRLRSDDLYTVLPHYPGNNISNFEFNFQDQEVFNLLIFWIQNQIILSCHFSEPRERSTALSTQAAMLVVLLFFQVDKRNHLYLVLYRFLNISCSLKKRSPAEHAEDREGFDARDRGQVFLWQLGHLHLHGKVPISFNPCSLDI